MISYLRGDFYLLFSSYYLLIGYALTVRTLTNNNY